MTFATRLGREICQDFAAASSREWLEANGIGGYSSSTVSGAHTRANHGLLVVHSPHTEHRTFCLARLEEALVIGDRSWQLSANIYPDSVHPEGYRLLKEFCYVPFPEFVYECEHFELRKTLFMPHGENAVVIRYELLRSVGPLLLELRPLAAARGPSGLAREGTAPIPRHHRLENRLLIQLSPDLLPYQIAHSGALILPTGHWYRSFRFPADPTSEPPPQEDLYSPCVLQFSMAGAGYAWIVASTRLDPVYPETVEGWAELETHRRRNLGFARLRRPRSDLESAILQSADRFLIRGPEGACAIVGRHPAPRETLRHAFLALPGLTLVTGRWSDARAVLAQAAGRCCEGLLPESVGGTETPQKGDLETSLWFVHAVDRYLRYTGDVETVQQDFYPAVQEIIRACRDGAHAHSRMDSDGLVVAPYTDGGAGDAAIPAKRVDLQALWYEVLGVGLFLAQDRKNGKVAREWSTLARLCLKSFQSSFWDPEANCLREVVGAGITARPAGPRRIIAAFFADSMLDGKQRQHVVEGFRREFLAAGGLRSLDTWWLGPFATAWVLAFGRSSATQAFVRKLLEPYWAHLSECGLGAVSERFEEGDLRRPGGAPWDAVAVGEFLRVYYEHVLEAR